MRHAYRLVREVAPAGLPWLASLTSVLPIAQLIPLNEAAKGTRAIVVRMGLPPRWSTGALLGLQLVISVGLWKSRLLRSDIGPVKFLLVGILLGLPWIAVEHELNRCKRRSESPPPSPRHGISVWQAIVVAAGALLFGFMAYASYYIPHDLRASLQGGRAPSAKESVGGPRGGYTLTAPSDGWSVLPPERTNDADLELVQSTSAARAIVRVTAITDGGSLQRAISTRRRVAAETLDKPLVVDEEHGFSPDPGWYPRSVATYTSSTAHSPTRVFAVTAASSAQIVEVVGVTVSADPDLERLGRSLQIDTAGEPVAHDGLPPSDGAGDVQQATATEEELLEMNAVVERRLEASGTMTEVGRFDHRGASAALLRRTFAEMSEGQRSAFLHHIFQAGFGEAFNPPIQVDGLETEGATVTLTWQLTSPNAVRMESGAEIVGLDGLATALARVAGSGARLRSEVRYHVPVGWRLTHAGPRLAYRRGGYELTRTATIAPLSAVLTSTVIIPAERDRVDAATHQRMVELFRLETEHVLGLAPR